MSEYFLEVRNISKAFQGVQALKNVGLKIRQGEAQCLVGENGCGKSTLIKIISGVHEPDEGEIIIEGKSYKSLRPKDSIALGIQVIYQDFSLFPNLSVAENITMASNLAEGVKRVNKKKNREMAAKVLGELGVEIPLDKTVDELPVAQRQLVAICRALLQDAKLVIMDEPTTALTNKEIENLYKVIEGLKKRNISLIFVSHKLDEVFTVSEWAYILRNGKNVIDGPTSDFDQSKMTYYMTGKEIEYKPFKPEVSDGTPLMQVVNFNKPGAFENINFELYKNEVLGITGLLGSGRTELAEAMFGLQSIETGEMYLDGKKIQIHSPSEAVKHGIGYVPEDRLTQGLFLDVEISRNISASILRRNANKFFFLNKDEITNTINEKVKELSIKVGSVHNPVKSLSGGNQQRVVLAKWLATNPKLLILNCPTVGVDVGSKSDIHEIIKELSKEGIGIIVISDDLPEILQVCSRVLVMNKGLITSNLITSDITQSYLQEQLIKS